MKQNYDTMNYLELLCKNHDIDLNREIKLNIWELGIIMRYAEQNNRIFFDDNLCEDDEMLKIMKSNTEYILEKIGGKYEFK